MAYVLWRVLMKKYSKVRLGIRNHSVIPAERRVPDKDETWSLPSDQQDECCGSPANLHAGASADSVQAKGGIGGDTESEAAPSGAIAAAADPRDTNLPRGHETRKSKTRRVKSYLRKCKGALTSKNEDSGSVERRERNSNCTSWYVDDEAAVAAAAAQVGQENEDEALDEIEIRSRTVAEDSQEGTRLLLPSEENEIGTSLEIVDEIGPPDENPRKDSGFSIYEDASDLADNHESVRERVGSRETLVLIEDSRLLNKCDSSDTLIADLPEIKQLDTSVSSVEEDDKIRLTTAPATGDSGGPLTVEDNGEYLQIGVVSFGDDDCPSSQPRVFTRVSTYSEWIQQVTGIKY